MLVVWWVAVGGAGVVVLALVEIVVVANLKVVMVVVMAVAMMRLSRIRFKVKTQLGCHLNISLYRMGLTKRGPILLRHHSEETIVIFQRLLRERSEALMLQGKNKAAQPSLISEATTAWMNC